MLWEAHFHQNSAFTDVLSECTKQASLIITVPKKMQGLSESCLEIPCSYNANPPRKLDGRTRTGGVWIKNDSRFEQRKHNVIFNSSEAHSDYPMKLTGNLRERDCTTLFSNLTTAHSNTYFFRLENTGFKATASCHPLQIKVQGKTLNGSYIAVLVVLCLYVIFSYQWLFKRHS